MWLGKTPIGSSRETTSTVSQCRPELQAGIPQGELRPKAVHGQMQDLSELYGGIGKATECSTFSDFRAQTILDIWVIYVGD